VRRLLLAVLLALGVLAGDAQAADRYAFAGGSYALQSVATGQVVAKAADGGYRTAAGGAEPFRLQATALGRYLLYGTKRDFMGVGSPLPVPVATPGVPLPVPGLPVPTTTQGNRVQSVATPSETADWRVTVFGEGVAIDLPAADGKLLTVTGDGAIVMRDKAAAGRRGQWRFPARGGCPEYPEVALGVSGAPSVGSAPWSAVRGLVDAHMHMMAFEFLGGRIHCGRPWHPYGAPYALTDCPDHYPNGAGAAAENVLSYGNPAHLHDPVGWPTFKDWPSYPSLTHEQSYYRWLERSWRAGQRMFVNLLVDNAVLCELYPLKKNSCNEMDGVRLQARRIHELQDYIDAQHGGARAGSGSSRRRTRPAR